MLDYIQGLHKLKQCLPDNEQQIFHTLEARLLDNLQKADLYGDPPTNSAERYPILAQLNKLALHYGKESFNDMSQERPVKRDYPLVTAPTSTEANKVQKEELQPTQEFPSSRAKVDVKLLAPVVPTAYCKNLKVDDFPLIRVTIDTTHARNAETTLHIYSWIEDYTDQEVKTVSLAGGETKQIDLFPLFKHDVVKQLNEVRTVTIHVRIMQTQPIQREYHETMRTDLLAYNAALLALELEDETVVDLSCHLAAWVTPNDQRVQAFLGNVVLHHNRQELEGYPDLDTCDDPPAFVRAQVQAVYEALKYDVKMKYVDASLVIGNSNKQIVQRVKLPAETLASRGNANCLDRTVLFASVLEAMSLQPLIMLEKGHAYLGWKIFERGKEEQYEFLETTLIDSADFAAAQQRGLERYQAALNNHLFKNEINDLYGYARQIDTLEWHKKGIHPLA